MVIFVAHVDPTRSEVSAFINTLIAIHILLVYVIVVLLPDALSSDRDLDPPRLPERSRTGRITPIIRALTPAGRLWRAFWRWGPAASALLLVVALGFDLYRILNNLADL